MQKLEQRPECTRILIIDDDRKLCRLIRDYLEPLGYQVSAAHTGHDGLELAIDPEESFEAIILDVMLPGIDGFEVLKHIRSQTDTPVLMLTSRGDGGRSYRWFGDRSR